MEEKCVAHAGEEELSVACWGRGAVDAGGSGEVAEEEDDRR